MANTQALPPLLKIHYSQARKGKPPARGPSYYGPGVQTRVNASAGIPLGFESASAGVQSGDLFPTIVTPDMARTKVAEVWGYCEALNEVRLGKKACVGASDPTYHATWAPIYQSVVDWRNKNQDTYWDAKGVYEEGERWIETLRQWQERLAKTGCFGTGGAQLPGTPAPSNKQDSASLADLGSVAKWGVAALALVGGIMLLRR